MKENRQFSEEKELGLIRARYENVRARFPLTLKRLQQSVEFQGVYQRCTEAGLKDWHVLQAVASITVNFRINYGQGFESFEEMQEAFVNRFWATESEADQAVPISEYSFENIQLNLDAALASYLVQKGYVIKNKTPNFKKLRAFADSKYRYFQLDIEHEPVFSMPKAG
jgi:hypothetical protein